MTWAPARRASKAKLPQTVKDRVKAQADALIESFLKPEHVKPVPEDTTLNYIVDIYSRWHGHYFYFCSKYCVPGPNALVPSFEERFARLEHVGTDRYNLAYKRHTGQWWPVYEGLSLDKCLEIVKSDPLFQP